MTRRSKLISRALRDPGGLRFAEGCALAKQLGFELVRTRGSHSIFKREGYDRLLNLQNVNGVAKAYQVRQILDAARELGLIEKE
ncbi:MAG: type II toxin-antitoxin system HicA family toxin [Candidatus Eisenbacteria sp.]|nr:type II toxin-antitoxin system HicA family toxin [Candidatus Eisenbacteria bacterium]